MSRVRAPSATPQVGGYFYPPTFLHLRTPWRLIATFDDGHGASLTSAVPIRGRKPAALSPSRLPAATADPAQRRRRTIIGTLRPRADGTVHPRQARGIDASARLVGPA